MESATYRIRCPYCDYELKLSQEKIGTFRPACRKCKQRFQLTITNGADGTLAFDISKSQIESERKKKITTDSGISPNQPASVKTNLTQTKSPNNVDETRFEKSASEPVAQTPSKPTDTNKNVGPRTGVVDTGDSRSFVVPDVQGLSVPSTQPGMPTRLGGYKIIGELGRGGLGIVYLARQMSLDRNVALKVVRSGLAKKSRSIARFIREAYSAAQLVHHNVVQIYDLGREGDTNFFSMEYVKGCNLSQLVKQQGRLEPEKAAGFILQAARGLQFAHRQGMVHRDIKPANLMINEEGIIKVADLGLVKIPEASVPNSELDSDTDLSAGSELTFAGSTVGTANYIAPEQAEDSSSVDHRADIYSLGCSFFVLLTGKPPFSGDSAQEIITKHQHEPIVRPDLVVTHIDPKLADIVVKMAAKQPENRYANLGDVIDDLETYLGISSAEILSPTEEQVNLLESSQQKFYSLGLGKLRDYGPIAFLGSCFVAAIFLAIFSWKLASAALVLGIVAILSYFVLSGFRKRGQLFQRVRAHLGSLGLRRWIQFGIACLILVVVMFVVGALPAWIVASILGMTFAAIFHFAVDEQLVVQRAATFAPVQQYLKQKRIAGVDEDSLQRFVAKYSDSNWEEYFESLFGYEALRKARIDLAGGPSSTKRNRFRPWRDYLIDKLDERLDVAKQNRDQEKLKKIEREALVSEGMPARQAEEEAENLAYALVAEGKATRRENREATNLIGSQAASFDPQAAAARKRARIKAMLAEAKSGRHKKKLASRIGGPLEMLFGNQTRLIAGGLLILGCVLWANQNDLFTSINVTDVQNAATDLTEAVTTANSDGTGELLDAAERSKKELSRKTFPLSLPLIGQLFFGFGSGIAGAILLLTSFFQGWKMSLFVFPAALIAWLGPIIGVPSVSSLFDAHVISIIVGLGLCVVGVLFGRTAAR